MWDITKLLLIIYKYPKINKFTNTTGYIHLNYKHTQNAKQKYWGSMQYDGAKKPIKIQFLAIFYFIVNYLKKLRDLTLR